MPFEQRSCAVLGIRVPGHDTRIGMQPRRELPVVEQEQLTARHARTDHPAHRPQHRARAPGHVLEGVFAGALADELRSGVAHAEPLPRATGDEERSTRGAVRGRVPDQRFPGVAVRRRDDDDRSAMHHLGHGVVGVAAQAQLDRIDEGKPEPLAGHAVERKTQRAGYPKRSLRDRTGDARTQ